MKPAKRFNSRRREDHVDGDRGSGITGDPASPRGMNWNQPDMMFRVRKPCTIRVQ